MLDRGPGAQPSGVGASGADRFPDAPALRPRIRDTVNLAARLEAHNKEAGQGILLDGDTQFGLAGRVPHGALGDMLFKGKSSAVPVFAVSGQTQA